MSGEQHQHVVGTEGRPPPATVTTSTCTTSTPIDSSTGSPKPSPPPSPKRSPRAPKEDLFYWVKKTSFLQRDVSYICQNINGPCPLLAICNVLLLRGHVSIDEHLHVMGPSNFIFARDVVSIVENRLAERVMLTEVVALVQTLQVGLDVNVQFHDIGAFEYTNACAIFDLLDMRLVHGWVVDPQDTAAYSLLAHKSYNQIVDRLIDYHSIESKAQSIPILMKERSLSMDDAALKVDQITTEGPVIDAFLADSASQLTYVGLIQLHEDLKERELAVFFRNNHFSTIFKSKKRTMRSPTLKSTFATGKEARQAMKSVQNVTSWPFRVYRIVNST
ncbi:hypothetical protein DYB26_009285 [Aphanomyces astaci]|uniref:MINDY deubiquitinase domain-containing protein n=2 Tax=Aphanomyces astaci TaxID=112090 RepID=A0A418FFN9_APHAT|nr:hypothetical protein DYB26_009285 [Aphanomyces astaci]